MQFSPGNQANCSRYRLMSTASDNEKTNQIPFDYKIKPPSANKSVLVYALST